MLEIENFIDGEFVPAVSQESLDDFNPATGQKIGNISSSGHRDVNNAVKAANGALAGWSSLSLDERIIWLEKIADALETKKEEIAKVESLDTGKPISLARRVDASRSITNFRFFSQFAKEQESLEFEMTDATNYVHRKPVGIVGLITPWNLPLYLLTWKIAPALVMGNTIIAKPSELTPLTANLFAKTLQEIDFPKGVFNIVHGLGPEAGQAILEHPEIKAISFTGGTQTGRIVARTAAPLFKKLSLELGGKSPVVVFKDARKNNAINGIMASIFGAGGQSCIAGSRLYLQEEIYDEYLEELKNRVEEIEIGDPLSTTTQLGPLATLNQLQNIEEKIKQTKKLGGKIITGGKKVSEFKNGYYFEPTIIECANHNLPVVENELFGPVLSVMKFKDEENAIKLMNDNSFGLAAGIFTENNGIAMRVSKAVEAGIVFVNTYRLISPVAPFGGFKNSGYGRESGLEVMKDYSNTKTTWINTSTKEIDDPFIIR